MTVLLPLYVYPADDPQAWAGAARLGAAVTVIVNVHNGPGERYDPTYGAAVTALAAAGVRRLGYVDLGYAARTLSEVDADIAGWRRYPVDGIFFDQSPAHAAALPWVSLAVATAPGLVVLNPGVQPAPGYATLADLVCTFEGPWSTYLAHPTGPDWANAAHLVYDIPPDDLDTAARRLHRRVTHGLLTHLGPPNPYAGLPAPLQVAT